MVNRCLPGTARPEIFAGWKVNNGFFCPPTGSQCGTRRLFSLGYLAWHGFCTQLPAAAWESRRHRGAAGTSRKAQGEYPMENALLVGLSRQMALSHELDVVANNIANINTTGYKADNTLFAEYLMPDARDDDFAGNDRRISFVTDRASWINFAPGAIQRT